MQPAVRPCSCGAGRAGSCCWFGCRACKQLRPSSLSASAALAAVMLSGGAAHAGIVSISYATELQ